jgi:16S rRNA (uracil1498-N3)-methyltransferase
LAEHRFYLGKDRLGGATAGETLELESDIAHRIARVLRLGPGERVRLFGEGREFECELVESRSRVRVQLLEELPKEAPSIPLILYQALIRPNRFEWLIEKVTELGATGIVPIVSDHTAVRAGEIGEERLRRWRRIAVEATEQCGRRVPPVLESPMPFGNAIEQAQGQRIFAWEGLRADEQQQSRFEEGEELSLFVGAEGGWSPREVDLARKLGARFLRLGPNILRAETAAIASCALLRLS